MYRFSSDSLLAVCDLNFSDGFIHHFSKDQETAGCTFGQLTRILDLPTGVFSPSGWYSVSIAFSQVDSLIILFPQKVASLSHHTLETQLIRVFSLSQNIKEGKKTLKHSSLLVTVIYELISMLEKTYAEGPCMISRQNLNAKYPPSDSCACEIYVGYCIRPGWWTVKEAARALEAGYGGRMMLEVSPDRSFGVLSPAFRSYEGSLALEIFKENGCNFFLNKICLLHGMPFQPLECRYCPHSRPGAGPICHADLERDWRTRLYALQWISFELYNFSLVVSFIVLAAGGYGKGMKSRWIVHKGKQSFF